MRADDILSAVGIVLFALAMMVSLIALRTRANIGRAVSEVETRFATMRHWTSWDGTVVLASLLGGGLLGAGAYVRHPSASAIAFGLISMLVMSAAWLAVRVGAYVQDAVASTVLRGVPRSRATVVLAVVWSVGMVALVIAVVWLAAPR